ncbi:MAG: response regulator [Candidatus Paceibacterota bacterium]|jgi:CheY-like chemotaxis protein
MDETKTDTAKKHYKILIVDDDKFLLSMYSMKFTREGMEVTAIPSPTEALEKLRGGLTPDIVILDVVMPEMDGVELLAKIREENLVKDAIVVILSNQGQPSDIDRAKAYGINGYIVKATTIPSEVLREIVRIAEENGK